MNKELIKLAESFSSEINSKSAIEASNLLQYFFEDRNSNDFIVSLCTHALSEKLASNSLNLSILLNNTSYLDLIKYLSDFDITKNKTSFDQILKMKEEANNDFSYLPDINNEKLIDSIYMSIAELNKMTFSSFNKNSEAGDIITSFDEKLYNFTDRTNAIEALNNMPFGFYLCKLPLDNVSFFNDSYFKNSYYLISNQSFGIFFAQFHIRKHSNTSLKNMTIYETDFFKSDDRADKNNLPANIGEDSIASHFGPSILYRISFMCYLIANQHDSIFDYDQASTMITHGDNSKSTELTIYNADIEHTKAFTLNDIKFKGNYKFMSFLDDMFSEQLKHDMHLINFKQDNERGIVTSVDFVQGYPGPQHYHDFTLWNRRSHEDRMGLQYCHTMLHPIPDLSYHDSDAQQKILRFALFNKMTMICLYLSYYLKENMRDIMSELESLSSNHSFDALALTKDIKSFHVLGLSTKNQSRFNSDNTILISQNPEQRKDFSKIRSHDQKSKAHKVVEFTIRNTEQLFAITGLSSVNQFTGKVKLLAQLMDMNEQLNKIAEKEDKTRFISFHFNYQESDPELLIINGRETAFKVLLPLGKKDFNALPEDAFYGKH